ncbi:MAG: CCA tRNA nucleotidyltransferase [Candidatus Micrarchaeia archaeon]
MARGAVFDEKAWLALRRDVLSEIKPTRELHEQVRAIADMLVGKLNDATPKDVEVMLTGSFAKDTYINTDVDFDIFLLFPESYSLDEMQSIAFGAGKLLLDKWEVAYAQHPYLRGHYKGHRVDVVPSYKIGNTERAVSGKIKSAVDRTQLHTRYVLERITEDQKDDVRILKKFLKRLGVYGAEIKTGGFSGYLCELLILKYGSFYKLVEAARHWAFPVAIDMAGGRSERLLRTLFKGDSFIVTDPVDPKRNVAAPVSPDSLATFVAASHILFMRPGTHMFFAKLPLMQVRDIKREIEKRGTHFLLFEFKKPDKAPDILWGELRKTLVAIEKVFDREEFNCTHQTAEVSDDKCYLLFELVHTRLPAAKMQEGPYVRMGEHLERFIREEMGNFDIFVKDERMCAVRPRKFTDALTLAHTLQKDPGHYGVSKGLENEIRSAKVFLGEDAVSESSREVFSKHLNRRFFLGL